jgi:hypothetical protein
MADLTLVSDGDREPRDLLDSLLEGVRSLVEDLESRRIEEVPTDVEAWRRRREFRLIQGGAELSRQASLRQIG